MNRIIDELKIDVGYKPTSLASTAGTGPYFPVGNSRKIAFLVNAASMVTGSSVAAQIMQATNAAAGGAKVVTNAVATITANTKVKSATVTLATLLAGSTVVINGLTFTAHASTTTYANREFSIGGDDTADAAALVLCINHETYGVPGVLASSAAGVITLTCTEPGEGYLTVVGTATTGVAATTSADAVVEIDASEIDTNNGFDHVAIQITTASGTIITGAMLVRGGMRYNPTQYLGASHVGIGA